jgi:toxin ParE1/3/4
MTRSAQDLIDSSPANESAWTVTAADDLEQIALYLKANDPAFAHSTVVKIYEAVPLRRFPNRGRAGLHKDTRELVVSDLPYLVVYQVLPDAVMVLRIVHGAQQEH